MKLKRLFQSLSNEDRDKVCAIINEVGIGLAFGTLGYREFLKSKMYTVTGNAREYIKLFRRLDKFEQERFFNAMVNYESHGTQV